MRIQTLGANGVVTGSCNLLQACGLNILIDYGIMQDNTKSDSQLYDINNRELPIDVKDIDYVIITHVHADHQNLVPLLSVRGFTGSIITTALTAEIMDVSLRDSAYIMNREVEMINKRNRKKKVYPIYLPRHVDMIMDHVRGYDFNQEIKLNDDVSVELLPTGHICGSASVMVTCRENEFSKKRILFTGDTSGSLREKPFTMKPDFEKLKPHTIVCETTYGNRVHPKNDPMVELEKHIRETVYDKGKVLIIPTFAISRSTELLYMLKKIYENNKELQSIPIHLASPMACTVHRILGKEDSFNFYDEKWKDERDLWGWDRVSYIEKFEDVQDKLCNKSPKIILAASGMLSGGYSNYLASVFLPSKGNKILFCGFQGYGTSGFKTLNSDQKSVSIDGKQVRKRADISFLGGMSSHADKKELIDLLLQVEKKKLKQIVLNHGDIESSKEFSKELKKHFDSDIIIPQYKQIIKV